MKYAPFIWLVLAEFTIVFGKTPNILYTWEKIPFVAYYDVHVYSDKAKHRFRTRHNSFVLPFNLRVSVVAIMGDLTRRVVTIKGKALNVPTVEKKKPPKPKQKILPKPTTQKPKILTRREKLIKQLEKQEEGSFEVDPHRYASLLLQLGREQLEAKGGTAQFSGTVAVSGTSFRLLMDTTDHSGFELKLLGYRFSTNQQSKVTQTSTEDEKTVQYFKVLAIANFLYKLVNLDKFYFSGGGGISTFSTPKLIEESSTSGRGELGMVNIFGPLFAVAIGLPFDKYKKLSLSLRYVPLSFREPSNATLMELELNWIHFITEQLFFNSILGHTTSMINDSFACESPQDTCLKNAEAKSTLNFIQLGGGLFF